MNGKTFIDDPNCPCSSCLYILDAVRTMQFRRGRYVEVYRVRCGVSGCKKKWLYDTEEAKPEPVGVSSE